MRVNYTELLNKSIHKYVQIRDSSDCTGDYISNANNVRSSYEIHDARDISYAVHVWLNGQDCFDVDTV